MRINFSKQPLKMTNKGFTLVELIIGIVVLSITFSVVFNLIMPASTQGASQVQQIRASELGQSLMNEITGRAFDENSDMAGGYYRCNENNDVGVFQPCSTVLGADGESRENFDDVDDYHNLNETGASIKNSLGQSLGELYLGFNVFVTVVYDGNYDGIADTNQQAKLITINVTTPTLDVITFSAYKVNF